MRFIVDANIIFSAIINTNSKIAEIILNSSEIYEFFAPNFLRHEIRKHYSKISGMKLEEIQEIEYIIYQNILFINEEQITSEFWEKAFLLTSDIDEKDTPYVAFAESMNCKIWSGDKKLISGLKKKKYSNFISTNELFEIKQKKTV